MRQSYPNTLIQPINCRIQNFMLSLSNVTVPNAALKIQQVSIHDRTATDVAPCGSPNEDIDTIILSSQSRTE